MDIQNQVKNIIIQQGGIAKSADFALPSFPLFK